MAPHGGEKRVARVEIHQTNMATKTLKHLFYDCDETVGQMVEELLTDELDMSMDQLTKQFELSVQLKDPDLGPDVFADMSKKRWKNETIENGGHYKVLLRNGGTNSSSSNVHPQQVNLLELSRQLESKGIRYIDRDNRQLLNDALTADQQKDCFVLLYSQSTLADEETMDKLSLCLEYLLELVGRGKECIFVTLGAQLLGEGDQNEDELPEAIRAIDGFPHIGVRIVKMNGDQLLTADYVSEEIKKLGLCTARIENSQLTDGTEPATGQTLLNCALPCPLSTALEGKCPNGDFLWGCDDCGKALAFVKQANAPIDHLFCACGRTPVEAFSFRCANVEEHGDIFCHFASKTVLTDQLVRLHKKEDLNILLMGETGIGKSTMINALLNYLKYPTMHEAIEADTVDFMIPARFNKTEHTATGRVEGKSVFLGEANAKERLDATKSRTQCATPYILPLKEGNKLCCVDSPGIVLLQWNLTHMHKSAIQNIFFLFTHSRGSDFDVANVLSLLEEELKPLEQKYGVELLHRNKFYCVDNETFEKLCLIKKSGKEYSKKDMENYAESWAKSEAECHRLLDYLSELPPHLTRESVSLTDARRIVTDLAQPMANIMSRIQMNLVDINKLDSAIGKGEKEKDEVLKYYSVEDVRLEYPRTVCTDAECTTVKRTSDGDSTIVFTQICHDRCGLDGVVERQHPNPTLKNCYAMDSNNNCEECRHSWDKHMHLRCEQRVAKRSVDQSLLRQISQNRGSLSNKQVMQRQFEKEKETLCVNAAILNSLSSFGVKADNDNTEAYLNMSIKQAEKLVAESKGRSDFEGNRRKLEAQQELLQFYKVMKNQKSVSGGAQITPNDVTKIVGELCALPLFGKDIKQMYDAHQLAQQKQQERFKDEMVYGGKNQKAKPSRNRYESNQQKAATFDYCKQKIAKGKNWVSGTLFGTTQQQSNAQTYGDCFSNSSDGPLARVLHGLSTTDKDEMRCSTSIVKTCFE
uniref:G domain-containing protein n=1 Tax=Globodera rostochiensis TaxID=31243 RepID=A0A914HF84_GLORO